jgi:anti-sigma B factor antagonist
MTDSGTAKVQIQTVQWNGHRRVALIGDLDIANVKDAESALVDMARTGTPLVLDMSGLSYLDSQGIGMLFRLSKQASLNGGSLSVANPHGIVRRVLEITECASVIGVIDDDGVDAQTTG